MYTLNCQGRLLRLDQPVVMGILNVTPDSFYTGSRVQNTDQALKLAEKMLKESALMLDVGGMSTRPDAEEISVDEELKRVIPAIEGIAKNFPEAIVSVDSYRYEVVKEALEAGARIVNDIYGGRDTAILDLAGERRAPYICMHMRGTPKTMQKLTNYDSLAREVLDYFIQQKSLFLKHGVLDMIIDPGFGFAKTAIQNFQLLKDLPLFQMLELPVMVGWSRKSTIYRTLGTTAEEALNGTTVMNTIALQQGAAILRVHDVKEAAEAIRLWMSYTNA
ncbi:MAG TPA: dihydropteroate synthase [Puia sp.]|nr:dihydropteroate synthase [Puia sp.]